MTYFKSPFNNLVLPKQLCEYTVMNIEPIAEHEKHKFSGQGAVSKKVLLIKTVAMTIMHRTCMGFVGLQKTVKSLLRKLLRKSVAFDFSYHDVMPMLI